MAGTTLRLGWTNPLTDVFGAHPRLGPVFDLNDGVTFTLGTPDGIELPPPPRTVVAAGNIRAQGEAATRAIYRHNRRVVALVLLGPMARYADLAANVRALVAWLAAPPDMPFSIQYQPIGASAPVYLDVVAAAHDIPEDEGQWLRLQFEPIELVFFCRPGLRGDRVTLQNLAVNPGFEAPSGPGVAVFSDAFASTNAYATQAGAAATLNPAATYVDTVLADAPLRYYRLGEASGTSASDLAGAGRTATYNGGVTLAQAGALAGDTDGSVALNGTNASISLPTTGLPSGAAPWTMECWAKVAAFPASGFTVFSHFGTAGTAAQDANLGLDSSGKPWVSIWGVNCQATTALTLNTWYHLAGTYDGASLRLYINGALVAGPLAATANIVLARADAGYAPGVSGAPYLNGALDELAIYSTALSAARIAAHYTAGASGPSGTVANAMSLPAGARIAFGSPAWGAINTWSGRFRWITGLSASFYPHYSDANNSLAVSIAAGANGFALTHRVAGASTTIATATAPLTHEGWYWLQLTQFPTVPGDPPYLLATLAWDNAGSPGVALATLAGPAADPTAGLTGRPQIAAAGASLALGGLASGAGHALSTFGPGGWLFNSFSDATGLASGAWDAATTYPNGPVPSQAAARIDAPPTGTLHAAWRLFTGGAPGGTFAVAVPSSPATFGISAAVLSSGLSAAATVALVVREYDASGALLRTGTAATLTGNQPAWAALAGTYATGAGCAYLDLACTVTDLSAPGASANATVWLDNVQCWNTTATGATTMPYCELRFPQSPASLVVSGLLGDLPAPAQLSFGAYLASLPAGGALTFAAGRRGQCSVPAPLAAPSNGFYGTAFSPQSTAALDPASYGGYYVAATVTGAGWNPRAFSPRAGDAPGVYHLWARFLTKQAAANLANVTARVVTVQQGSPWFGKSDFSDYYATAYGPSAAPATTSNAWTVFDAGQAGLPPFVQGAMADPSQTYFTPRPQVGDTTAGGSACEMGWQMLLPVDGSLLLGVVNNPINSLTSVANSWLWIYADPLGQAGGAASAWTYSIEAAATPAPARGAGGPGTQSTGTINVNPGADPYLTLDPQLRLAGGVALNQLAALLTDNTGAVLPFHAEIAYSPLYLYPR